MLLILQRVLHVVLQGLMVGKLLLLLLHTLLLDLRLTCTCLLSFLVNSHKREGSNKYEYLNEIDLLEIESLH